MTQPLLTIGMATHTDYYGCVDTIQHIRLTNRRLSEIEFIVVDSSIGSPLPLSQSHSKDLKNFLVSCNHGTAGIRLVEMPEAEGFGTTQPRNRVFAEGTGKWKFCIDSHIQTEPYAWDRVIDWAEAHPDCNDLIQGPILHDNLQVMASGFADVWNDEMWGIWDLDRRCLSDGPTEDLPVMDRQQLTAEIEPFEIESMGLGLFGCRAEAWLGFNEHFRGFGGEEWYIHRKFRKAGRKCLCLPFLRWWHRFGRPGGISYTISTDHKVRNYILGHRELDDSVAGIHQQFVASGKLPEQRWKWLLADPVNNVPERHVPQMIRSQGAEARPNNAVSDEPTFRSSPQPEVGRSLDEVFNWCANTPRDLNEHLPTFRRWAAKCQHVTEFSERRESSVGLLAGRPTSADDPRKRFHFRSYNLERDYLLSPQGALHEALRLELDRHREAGVEVKFHQTVGDSMEVPTIEETDLLFIDTKHNGQRLSAELMKHGSLVRRAIMVHDTAGWMPLVRSQGWGEKGDDGGAGLNEALRNWVENNPEWFVAEFDPNQYGLTILSKHPEDRPSEPVNAWLPGWGVGTEFQKILHSIDINPSPGCDCNAKAAQMDIWGPTGCEENFDQIITWLREGEVRWGWKDKWGKAAAEHGDNPLFNTLTTVELDEVIRWFDAGQPEGQKFSFPISDDDLGEVVAWLQKNKSGVKEKLSAGSKLLWKDPLLAITLDPADPFPGLIRASIKRAKKHQLKLLKDRKQRAKARA